MKKIFVLISVILYAVLLTNCQGPQESSNTIKVGTIIGPESQLMDLVRQEALKKYHLKVIIVAYTDYTMPNQALYDEQIDANLFQTLPYLQADMQARSYQFVVAAKMFIYPMALYSKKISAISQLANKATVAIPSDPSNEERALLLLQQAGLITVKMNPKNMITPFDITANPKHLRIKPMDAAQITKILPKVGLAAINTNYAVAAGLYPTKDGLVIENKKSPYVNVLVVRQGDENLKKVKELVAVLQSPEIEKAAEELFKGQAIVGW